MNADQEAGVLAAAKQLSIKDVVLASCRFERPARGVPDVGTEVHQAHKRGVEYQIIEVDSEGASERQLQVLVELGVRISSDAPDGVDAPIHVQIEAEFVVVYEVLDDIDETCIYQFDNFNHVHKVWTFWRQLVLGIFQRAKIG